VVAGQSAEHQAAESDHDAVGDQGEKLRLGGAADGGALGDVDAGSAPGHPDGHGDEDERQQQVELSVDHLRRKRELLVAAGERQAVAREREHRQAGQHPEQAGHLNAALADEDGERRARRGRPLVRCGLLRDGHDGLSGAATGRQGLRALLREELIAAASAVLEEVRDADAMSTRAVVERAGVTAPSLYRHFACKDDLVVAVLTRRFADLSDALRAAGAAASDPCEALAGTARAYLDFGRKHPGPYRVMFSSFAVGPSTVGDSRAGHPGTPALEAVVEQVAAALRCPVHHPTPEAATDATAQVVAWAIWAALHGTVDLSITDEHRHWPDPERHVQLILGLVGVAAAAEPSNVS
jgi:AcrR family transcriptional regulator